MAHACVRANPLLSGSCALGAAIVLSLVLDQTAVLRSETAAGASITPASDLPASRLLVQPASEAFSSKQGWRGQSERGEYDAAAERLLRGDAKIIDEPAALMEAADALRFANQPLAAVDCLRRILRDHVTSPVAPLAGFTLGRVLLERLGQPSEAAEAFALARSLKPDGSLAQDALASEVEAWSKAGRALDAFQRARLYVQLYPKGRRVRAVRTLGGL